MLASWLGIRSPGARGNDSLICLVPRGVNLVARLLAMPFPDSPHNHKTEDWDDDPWEAFIADEDQCDPLPEPGDFWPEIEEEF
mgnify:CR=1 FL=1